MRKPITFNQVKELTDRMSKHRDHAIENAKEALYEFALLHDKDTAKAIKAKGIPTTIYCPESAYNVLYCALGDFVDVYTYKACDCFIFLWQDEVPHSELFPDVYLSKENPLKKFASSFF